LSRILRASHTLSVFLGKSLRCRIVLLPDRQRRPVEVVRPGIGFTGQDLVHESGSPFAALAPVGHALAVQVIRDQELIESVAPIQLTIRLLIPAGSRLLELGDLRGMLGEWDGEALVYVWRNWDSRVDDLCEKVQRLVHSGETMKQSRARIFKRIWEEAHRAAGLSAVAEQAQPVLVARAAIPYLNEPWYC